MDELTAQAKAAIGEDDPNSDGVLAPKTHADRLPRQAGGLRRILEQTDVHEIIATFEAEDKEAIAAQRRYKRIARTRLYAGAAAAIVGASFVLPLDEWAGAYVQAIAAVQYVCLAASIFAALLLVRSMPFDAWMKARAKAEIARIALFNQVMDAVDPSPEPNDLPLLPLKLEYFRRYQLDVQRRYYARRGRQHARAAGQTRRWQIESLVLTCIAGMVAFVALLTLAIDRGLPVPDWLGAADHVLKIWLPHWSNKAVLAIGIIASVLFGASVSRSLMDLDERNASRYLTTAANLDHVRDTGLEAARAHAAAGDADKVRIFVNSVQHMVSSEHQEWVVLGEALPGTLRKGLAVQLR